MISEMFEMLLFTCGGNSTTIFVSMWKMKQLLGGCLDDDVESDLNSACNDEVVKK